MAINPATLQLIGTGLSIVSAIGAGRARANDAEFNRYQYELDAQANLIEGRQKANLRLRNLASANSSNNALFAFMNRDIGSDRSYRPFMEAQKRIAHSDAESIGSNALRSAAQSQSRAGMEEAKGRASLIAGYTGAASAIVSGLYRYEQYKVG